MSQYGSIVRISGFKTEPNSEHECLEAIWTQGSACKNCEVKCYRSGWSKQRSSTDNKQQVGNKL